jgi:hypothetical protein
MERMAARSITTLVVAAAAASVVAVGAAAVVRGVEVAHPGSVAHVDAMQVGPVHPLLPGLLPPIGTVGVSDVTPSSATPPPTLDAIERMLRELLASPRLSASDASYLGPVHPIVPGAVQCVQGLSASAPVARCAAVLPTVDPTEGAVVDLAAREADQVLQGDSRPPVH